MKLRIKGNSLRLRLTRSEVEKLANEDTISESTDIAGNIFRYSLQKVEDINDLSAEYTGDGITISIPVNSVKGWSENDTVGFENTVSNNKGESLHILVEKDFKCIEETTEDQSDNFDNPNISCSNEL